MVDRPADDHHKEEAEDEEYTGRRGHPGVPGYEEETCEEEEKRRR